MVQWSLPLSTIYVQTYLCLCVYFPPYLRTVQGETLASSTCRCVPVYNMPKAATQPHALYLKPSRLKQRLRFEPALRRAKQAAAPIASLLRAQACTRCTYRAGQIHLAAPSRPCTSRFTSYRICVHHWCVKDLIILAHQATATQSYPHSIGPSTFHGSGTPGHPEFPSRLPGSFCSLGDV